MWETHEVREEMNHSWFASFHLLSVFLLNMQLSHEANAHPSLNNRAGTYHPTSHICSRICLHGDVWRHGTPTPFTPPPVFTFLACKSESEVDCSCLSAFWLLQLRRRQPRAGSSPIVYLIFLTSQRCTAVSIDTCNALVRFTGPLSWETRECVYVPLGF